MENLYLGKTHDAWIRDFAGRMESLEYGSSEYKKCRRIYAWLANQIRLADKIRIEELN